MRTYCVFFRQERELNYLAVESHENTLRNMHPVTHMLFRPLHGKDFKVLFWTSLRHLGLSQFHVEIRNGLEICMPPTAWGVSRFQSQEAEPEREIWSLFEVLKIWLRSWVSQLLSKAPANRLAANAALIDSSRTPCGYRPPSQFHSQ